RRPRGARGRRGGADAVRQAPGARRARRRGEDRGRRPQPARRERPPACTLRRFSVAEELVMPRLSDTMERGTIARWLVKEGDRISNGDVLAEIETDKAVMELQAYDDGVLLQILVGEGESAELGAPIALVGEEGEAPAADGDAPD